MCEVVCLPLWGLLLISFLTTGFGGVVALVTIHRQFRRYTSGM